MLLDGSPGDLLVVVLVVGGRLLLPLLIPWRPLPGILAALTLDAIDQTLFQSLTRIPLEGYQAYDKALDVYYQSIAYLSTLRNWEDDFAFRTGRLLFYLRLAGVALFEWLDWRILLFLLPNTFEYYFIWYELLRLRREPRLAATTVVSAAAAIWIVVKLPQEYWLHIARLDLTDVLKTALFGASPATPWGHIFRAAPWLYAGVALLGVGVIVALAWLATRARPTNDRRPTTAAAQYPPVECASSDAPPHRAGPPASEDADSTIPPPLDAVRHSPPAPRHPLSPRGARILRCAPPAHATPRGVRILRCAPSAHATPRGVRILRCAPSAHATPRGVRILRCAPSAHATRRGARILRCAPSAHATPRGVRILRCAPSAHATPRGVRILRCAPSAHATPRGVRILRCAPSAHATPRGVRILRCASPSRWPARI